MFVNSKSGLSIPKSIRALTILPIAFFVTIIYLPNLVAENIVPPLSGVVAFQNQRHIQRHNNNNAPRRDDVGPNRLASDDRNHNAQNESAIFINPSDSQHIVGGSNDYRAGDANCGWFVSFDGGETWESGLVDGLNIFGLSGDPTVVIDRDGIVYMGGIHFNRNQPRRGGIFVSRSDDGGLSYEDPSWVIIHEDDNDPPFEDKPFLGIDNTGGEHDGNIYVSWTRFGTGQIYFSRSIDGAESWSEPMRLTGSRGQGSVPVVGPGGKIYVIWKNFSRDEVVGMMSDDGGESFGDLFVVAETEQLPGNLEPTNFRTHSLPSSGVDQSDGDNRGRVYVTWADIRSDDADILLAFSADFGENWSDPLRLNDDEAENGLDQFFPWLSVDPSNGEMSAIWYDRRLDDNNIMVDVYGVTWNGIDDVPANERISSTSFDPRIGFNGAFFGDYIGVSASNGFKIAGWCDTRANNQDIYAANLEYNHFPNMEGEDEHLMIVESVLINGEAADPNDEIAVFDQTYELKGSAFVGDEETVELIAYGQGWPHNPNESVYICWKVWDRSANEEYFASAVYLDGDEFYRVDGETTLNLIAPPPAQQQIDLIANWSIISTHVIPHNLDPWEMFMPVHDQLELVKDQEGNFLRYDFNFSNMDAYEVLKGYFVKVNEDVVFEINGIQIDAQTPLLLDQCWNVIGYPPDYELEPWYAFDSIIDQIFIVKDEQGRFLVPEAEFSNMENLRPGEGYQMKVCEDVELIFPDQEEMVNDATKSYSTLHYIPMINSPVNMSLLVQGIDNFRQTRNFLKGEIAAISPSGVICGASVVNDTPPFGMAIWGDGIESKFESNLRPGEEFTLVYWDEHSDTEFRLESTISKETLIYEPDELVIASLKLVETNIGVIKDFSIDRVFPNPFNSTSTVGFTIHQTGTVIFSLFDISGRSIVMQSSKVYNAGHHLIEIDGSEMSSGLYIASIALNDRVLHTKIALIR